VEDSFVYILDNEDVEFEKIIDVFKDNFNFKSIKVDLNYNEKVYYIINQNKLHKFCIDGTDFLIDSIKEKVRYDDNFKILIHSAHESLDETNINVLHDYVIKNNLEQSKFFLLNNSANLEEIQTKCGSKFNCKKLNYLSHLKINDMIRSTKSIFKIEKEEGKFFMTFNKEDKVHRYLLLIFLKGHNLLEDTNWSYLPTFKRKLKTQRIESFLSDGLIKKLKNEIDYFINLNYKFSDYEKTLDYNLENVLKQTMVEDVKNYENSYFNLTTESVFDERKNAVHITEKSFKPFYYYQFPLILSSENHIKKMKELYDFDFFEDVIDHSYDSISDNKERFLRYCNEINRIYQNKDFFINFYNTNKERFESNKNKVFNVVDLIKDDNQFFLNLI
jgi:hypothetical protein